MDAGWPSLRSLAVITPIFVLGQVILGAAFRHKTGGLTWHIVGAMVVSLLVLLLGMFVMQQFPKHQALRPGAIAMLSLVLLQVLLGIAAITTEMLASSNTVPASVTHSTAAHVAVGSLTLAATLVLSIQIRRNVQKPAEEPEEDESTAKA
jgi:heme A synthase